MGCTRWEKPNNFNNFYLSTLLYRKDDVFSIKYDSLEFWIKARYFSHLINSQVSENNIRVLKILALDCYKGGALVKEISKHKKTNTKYEENIIRLKSKSLRKNDGDIFSRKIISALLYIYFQSINKNRADNSNAIEEIFENEKTGKVNGLSIYGSFYPLDFSSISVSNGYFNDYTNLKKSNIPTEKLIFSSCQFLNMRSTEISNGFLSKANFSDDCEICDGLHNAINLNADNYENKLDTIKKDLKKIFGVGFRSGAFSWKSEHVYKQQCATLKSKTSLSKFLNILEQEGFLLKENSTSSVGIGYRVKDNRMLEVKEFLPQSLASKNITNLIKKLLSD